MVLLPILYNGVGYSPPPKKISPFPFPPRGPGPRPLHCYTSVHNPNGFSIKVQPMVFRVCLYFTIGRVCPPEKFFSPFLWGTLPRPNTLLLWPTTVHNPNGISIGSAVFAGLMVVSTAQQTDRLTHTPTDHATPIATGRIYALHYDALYSEALQQSQTWFCYGNILSVPRLLVK